MIIKHGTIVNKIMIPEGILNNTVEKSTATFFFTFFFFLQRLTGSGKSVITQ